MNYRAILEVQKLMNDKKINFHTDVGPYCHIELSRGELKRLIQISHGVNPRKKRIMEKKLSQIVREILNITTKYIKEGGCNQLTE